MMRDRTSLVINEDQWDRITNETRVVADISQVAAENAVSIATILTFDNLRNKIASGSDTQTLSDTLIAQTAVDDSLEDPGHATLPIESLFAVQEDDTESNPEDDNKTMTLAELNASNLPQSSIPSAAQTPARRPERILSPKRPGPIEATRTVIVDNKTQRTRRDVYLAFATIATVLGIMVTWRSTPKNDRPLRHQTTATTERADRGNVVEQSITGATKPISMNSADLRATRWLIPTFPRADEQAEVPAIVSWTPTPESDQRYTWDEKRHKKLQEGKIAVGPWQVAAQPRNRAGRSSFSSRNK